MKKNIEKIHKESIILDCCAAAWWLPQPDPLDRPYGFNAKYIQNLRKGGVTAIHIAKEFETFSNAVTGLKEWFKVLRTLEPLNVRLVTTVKEIRESKEEGGIAIILGHQKADFLELDVSNLELFYRLGMRTNQLTYNHKNQFGSGCMDKIDSGLSNLGVQWVEEMNKLGMAIDLSHVGFKTSMDTMNISKDPVIFSHSSAKALCDHPRNITDEQIQTCADEDGVIGLCPLSWLLRSDKLRDQSVDDLMDHIDYVVDLVGVNHVGIGIDHQEVKYYTREQIQKLENKNAAQIEFLKSSKDKIYVHEYSMPWLKSISEMPIITEALMDRSYSNQEIKKILGENFFRVFKQVWGS
jgi:membrane dipeptidase